LPLRAVVFEGTVGAARQTVHARQKKAVKTAELKSLTRWPNVRDFRH
jgi:hypothetical protein